MRSDVPVYDPPSRYGPTRVVRRVDNEDDNELVALVLRDDVWHEELPGGHTIPLAGARDITVAEFTRGHERRVHRYGEWVELRKDVAHAHPELLTWCRRRCNSELPSGGFRFSPKDWDRYSAERLSLPFIPEFDDPNPLLREIAAAERRRRHAQRWVQDARAHRDDAIRAAAKAGYSRRAIGKLVGLTFGRVQQIVTAESARPSAPTPCDR
jgi:hypothetical protein